MSSQLYLAVVQRSLSQCIWCGSKPGSGVRDRCQLALASVQAPPQTSQGCIDSTPYTFHHVVDTFNECFVHRRAQQSPQIPVIDSTFFRLDREQRHLRCKAGCRRGVLADHKDIHKTVVKLTTLSAERSMPKAARWRDFLHEGIQP